MCIYFGYVESFCFNMASYISQGDLPQQRSKTRQIRFVRGNSSNLIRNVSVLLIRNK